MKIPRFVALRIVVGLQILCGSLLVICSVFMFLAVAGGELGSPELRNALNSPLGILVMASIFFTGITWIAFAQLIQVVLRIEENTRKETKDNDEAS